MIKIQAIRSKPCIQVKRLLRNLSRSGKPHPNSSGKAGVMPTFFDIISMRLRRRGGRTLSRSISLREMKGRTTCLLVYTRASLIFTRLFGLSLNNTSAAPLITFIIHLCKSVEPLQRAIALTWYCPVIGTV